MSANWWCLVEGGAAEGTEPQGLGCVACVCQLVSLCLTTTHNKELLRSPACVCVDRTVVHLFLSGSLFFS